MYKYIYFQLYIFPHTSAFPVTSPRCHFETGKSVWGNVACVRARMLKRSCSRKESSEFSKEKKIPKHELIMYSHFRINESVFSPLRIFWSFFAVRTISQTQDIFLLSPSLFLFILDSCQTSIIGDWKEKLFTFFLKDLLINDVYR